MLNEQVLVLNERYQPSSFISVKDAICDIFTSKATVILSEDRVIHSPSMAIPIPTVIFKMKEKPRKVKFSKLNVLYRDDLTCSYCNTQHHDIRELTLDHVIPKSRWTEITGRDIRGCSSWKNLVTACKSCNTKKGNRLVQELKWHMHKKPHEPAYLPYLMVSRKKAEAKGWMPFFDKFNMRIVEIAK